MATGLGLQSKEEDEFEITNIPFIKFETEKRTQTPVSGSNYGHYDQTTRLRSTFNN